MTPPRLKTELVQLRLTSEEKKELMEQAEAYRMSISAYLRWLILKAKK